MGGHTMRMTTLHMITFRCPELLFMQLEEFARQRKLDRTSVLKLALHYYLNALRHQYPNQQS